MKIQVRASVPQHHALIAKVCSGLELRHFAFPVLVAGIEWDVYYFTLPAYPELQGMISLRSLDRDVLEVGSLHRGEWEEAQIQQALVTP